MANALIEAQAQRLQADYALYPHIASEIEFYLHGSSALTSVAGCYDAIRHACQQQGIQLASIEAEKGFEQHEVSLLPSPDAVKIARDTDTLKRIITEAAQAHGLTADFSAKPSATQPGSGLHIHVHLADAEGKSHYFKKDDQISDVLKHSIGGLLACMQDCMAVFAPTPASYARFVAGSNTPVCVSWGANNRTVAVRLPDAAPDKKHIEHRVAGADADTGRVIAVILASLHYGLANKCEPAPQVYGDAALPMYNLPRLHASFEEAKAALLSSKIMADYFSVQDLL